MLYSIQFETYFGPEHSENAVFDIESHDSEVGGMSKVFTYPSHGKHTKMRVRKSKLVLYAIAVALTEIYFVHYLLLGNSRNIFEEDHLSRKSFHIFPEHSCLQTLLSN